MKRKLFHRPGWVLVLGWSLAASLLAGAQSASNGFWQAQSIYQVITDRFFDGDASNNNADGNYSRPARPRSTAAISKDWSRN